MLTAIVLFFALIGGMVAVTPPDMYPSVDYPCMNVRELRDHYEITNKHPMCCPESDCSTEYPWLTKKKVEEYEALERFLVGGGTKAIIEDAAKKGCFDRIKIVNGKEIKNCWGAIKPAGKRLWECEELSRSTVPQCYEDNP
jgi:hypothetical protein